MKIGIDIGATSVRVAKIKEKKVIDIEIFDTNKEDWKETLGKIDKYIEREQKNETLELIGLCCPGPADIKEGKILITPNLPDWQDLEIKKYFEDKYNVEVLFNNDANVAGLGQALIRNKTSLLYFTVSTGIGAGLVINNQIHNGFSYTACEVANANPTLTGEDQQRTGIEYLASGINIPRVLKTRGVDVKDAREAFELLIEGKNQIVIDYFKEVEDRLVQLFSTAIYFINPEMIVIGGSVAENNKWFFEKIFKRVHEVTIDIHYKTPFEFAQDITNATLLGSVHK
ncbi:glucokinase [Spiroplasma chinense]|uniref:Glucokinase n=1 Tax=Spiroplasma chinense TaxID=216932 RepID=A0A5B9Y3E2_9MOLU|nr:ROK family protein [Spiroplasma chinense]QEH61511.1 glucokinase [Spiroplasma chinense]